MNDRERNDKEWNDIRNKNRKRGKRRNPKVSFSIFLTVVVFIGVIVSVSAFAVIFSAFVNSDAPPVRTAAPTPTAAASATSIPWIETPSNVEGRLMTITALIVNTTSAGRKIELYDVEVGKTYMFAADELTDMRDKYGQPMLFAEFSEGDIVEAKFVGTSAVLSSLRISPEAFTRKNVTNARVDFDDNSIRVGNDVYNYTYKLICKYRDRYVEAQDVDPIDTVTVKGYKNTAWFMEIITGHGVVTVTKRDEIMDALLIIDTTVYKSVDADLSFTLREGEHKATVRGTNIPEPHQTEFYLGFGETYDLDLNTILLNAGKFAITFPDGAKATLNGAPYTATAPMWLSYGEYTVRVEQDGFEPFEKLVAFYEPSLTVDVTLVEIPPTPTPAPTEPPTPKPVIPVATEKPKFGEIFVDTDPNGAEVFIDQKYVGKTPISISTEYGLHTFQVRLDGYQTITFSQNVGEYNVWPRIPLQQADTVIDEPPIGEPIMP